MEDKDIYELKFYINKEQEEEEIEALLILYNLSTNYFVKEGKEESKFSVYGKKGELFRFAKILKEKGIKTELSNNIILWKYKEEGVPYTFIEGVIINPTLNKKINTKDIVINLIPGLAFGTGRHESTKIAARLLMETEISGKRVLDIGCGSGILSVLSKKLGASYVKGIDNEPQAIEKSKETAKLNKIKIDVMLSNLVEGVEEKYDIIVANILPDILEKLLPKLPKVTLPHSKIIFSGIYEDRKEYMKSLILDHNYTIEREFELNRWYGFLFSPL